MSAYDDVFNRAENGDQHAMIELFKLYDCGLLGHSELEQCSRSVYWVERFFAKPIDGCEKEDVVEACLFYATWYGNSTNIEEVGKVIERLKIALEFDFPEWEVYKGLLAKEEAWLSELKEYEGGNV